MNINAFILVLLGVAATNAQNYDCTVRPTPLYPTCRIDLTVAIDMSTAMKNLNNVDALVFSVQELLSKYDYGVNTEATVITFGVGDNALVVGSSLAHDFNSLCAYIDYTKNLTHQNGLFDGDLRVVFENYKDNVLPPRSQRVFILFTAIDDSEQVQEALSDANILWSQDNVQIITVTVGKSTSQYLPQLGNQSFVFPSYEIGSTLLDQIVYASCINGGGTYSTPLPVITTTVPPTPTSPYPNGGDGVPCATNPKQAWLDLVVLIEHSDVTFLQWSAISSSVVSTIAQLALSNTVSSGHTSRIALITYNSTGTVLQFSFTSEQNVRNVQIALNKAKPPPNAGGKADIASGLKAAGTYLTNNTSFRVPGVVLYAATYDASGSHDPETVADELKDDLIKIVTVSYDSVNGVSTPKICALASPGLCLSTQSPLTQFGWAVSQLNCRCPKNWSQLVVNNKTSYADCFLYQDTMASQAYSMCPAETDILALASTPARVDFIGQLVSKNPTNVVSVGLLRTDAASKWRWQSEYLWTGYPPFAQSISNTDVYGYLSKDSSNNWQLLADDGVSAGRYYVCQRRSADTDNIIN